MLHPTFFGKLLSAVLSEKKHSYFKCLLILCPYFILKILHSRRYIEEEDLRRFMYKDEVETVFMMLEGAAETGKITRNDLKHWMVRRYL